MTKRWDEKLNDEEPVPNDLTPDERDAWRSAYVSALEGGSTKEVARKRAEAALKNFRQQQREGTKALAVLHEALDLPTGTLVIAPGTPPDALATTITRFLEAAEEEKSTTVNEDPRDSLRQLAERRAREQGLSLREAVSRTSAENPALTCAAMNAGEYGPLRFAEPTSKQKGTSDNEDARAKLNRLALQRSYDEGVSVREALMWIVEKHPDLARMAQTHYYK